MKKPKPKFRIGQAVRISNGYTGKVVQREWIAGGWCYKMQGSTWRGEEALTAYQK